MLYNNHNPNERNNEVQELADIQQANDINVKELADYKKQINPILHPVDKLKSHNKLNKLATLTKKVNKFNYDYYNRNPSLVSDLRSASIAHKVKSYQKKYGEESMSPVIHRTDISLFSNITEVNLININ